MVIFVPSYSNCLCASLCMWVCYSFVTVISSATGFHVLVFKLQKTFSGGAEVCNVSALRKEMFLCAANIIHSYPAFMLV